MNTAAALVITTPSDSEIVTTRSFAAPPTLVFEALTRPELLRRWYGPHGHQLVVCEIDLRVGGSWRYVVRAPDGTEMQLHGEYREISPPTTLVQTETNDDCWAGAGERALITSVLTENPDLTTTLTVTARYASMAIRDDVLRSGMDRGLGESYQRLAGVVTMPGSAGWRTGARR